MANLTAVFELVDRISSKLDAISGSGSDMIEQFDRAESAASDAFDAAETGGQKAATVADGVATSIADMADSADTAAESMKDAGDSADYWTDAIGNYDKSAMEAIYTTEELVEMGYKTGDALQAEADAAKKAEESVEGLGDETKKTKEEEEELGKKGEEAFQTLATALADAGITKLLNEATNAVYDLAEAFSEAESVIVKATGATGDALDDLTSSALKVYATVDDGEITHTAAAIGELNTRLGLTGTRLETDAKLFMDFADITGSDVVGSIASVTQIMKRWGVEEENTSLLLDELAYAAQASGINVDTLTGYLTTNKATLDLLGFSLEQSIAMFSQFELEGINTTAVMTGLRSALSSGTITSLEELYDVFEQITAGEMSAADAAEIFGSRAGAEIVAAVDQGALSLDEFVSKLEECEGTCQKTEEAADTMADKWTEASNTMKTAVDGAISPVVQKLSNVFATVVQGVGNFLTKHPTLTKALTSVAVGLGVVTAGIVAVTFAVNVAKPAIISFFTSVQASMGPIGWISLAITGVVAAVAAFAASMEEATTEYDTWTSKTQEQYDEIQSLKSAYEEACATYGETSYQAQELAYQIDNLTTAFENNKQTQQEYRDSFDTTLQGYYDMVEEHEQAISKMNLEGACITNLVGRLDTLTSQTSVTAAEKQEILAIISQLNEQIPDLCLSYDELTNSMSTSTDAILALAEAQLAAQRYEEYQSQLIEKMNYRTELIQRQTEALEQQAAAQQQLNYYIAEGAEMNEEGEYVPDPSKWDFVSQNPDNPLEGSGYVNKDTGEYIMANKWNDVVMQAQETLNGYTADVEAATAAIEDNEAAIESIANEMAGMNETVQEGADGYVSYNTAVTTAIGEVRAEVEELCAAYDEAYSSAYSSISSQIGLFDTMKTETTTSIADMQAAFESQTAYLETYTENLRKAAEYGISDGLISALSDGSEESAGYLNEIVTHIEELGGEGSEAAQEFVSSFNDSFAEVETAKEEFADTVAKMETDFDEKMADIEGRLDEAIDNMNMEADAAEAAAATMDAYTQTIRDHTAAAVTAAQAAADAVKAALNSSFDSDGTSSASVPGHARGTTNSEDAFFAGEDGPELIIDKGGSTVFPAEETNRIITAVHDYEGDDNGSYIPPSSTPRTASTETGSSSGERKITLEINGSGSMQIGGGSGVSKEDVVDILYEQIKPALLDIVNEEIFEEGDSRYEY